jgi:polyphosphate glucokinase
MKVLAIDVGGTHVKILVTGQNEHRQFVSGPSLTPAVMVAGVKDLVRDWKYDVVSIGYPGPVRRNRPVADPYNLGKGWLAFDYRAAFQRPVKIINDAAMQALGSYRCGLMLFLGLGTGLGSAMIMNGLLEPMELAHLPYQKTTFEDYVGIRGLEKYGKEKWRKFVVDVVERLIAALEPDDVVLGGGNVKKLKTLPAGCRSGDNANSFLGGFRLWNKTRIRRSPDRFKAGFLQAQSNSTGCQEETKRITTMKNTIKPLTQRPAWKALATHHKQIKNLHLRKLFAADSKRGERMTVEAAGLFLDYSKNRITNETLKLLLKLAEESAIRLKTRMRDPAHVPELEKNSSARLMHSLGDFLPSGDLFVCVDAGRIGTASALLGNRHGFADNQSRRRPLGIILRHQRRRHAIRPCAHPRERSHDNAV